MLVSLSNVNKRVIWHVMDRRTAAAFRVNEWTNKQINKQTSKRARLGLTDRLAQAVHSLVVGVRLVPDEGVGQVWFCRKPLLEEPSHHGHHQVHLHQVKGDGGLSHGDLQDRAVPGRSRTQVHQVQIAAGDRRDLLENLRIPQHTHRSAWRPEQEL